MTKEEIEAVIRVLKDNINDNEDLLNDSKGLSKVGMDSIKFESAACCKAIRILEAIGDISDYE